MAITASQACFHFSNRAAYPARIVGRGSNNVASSLGGSGTLTLAGQRHDLAALRGTPILTVEAGKDGLVGPGQTHAIGRLLSGARAETLAGAEHHELFTGPDFARTLPPVLRRFYNAQPRAS